MSIVASIGIDTLEDRVRFEVQRCYRDYLDDMTDVYAAQDPFTCERAALRAMGNQRTIDSLVWAFTHENRGVLYVNHYAISKRRMERAA